MRVTVKARRPSNERWKACKAPTLSSYITYTVIVERFKNDSYYRPSQGFSLVRSKGVQDSQSSRASPYHGWRLTPPGTTRYRTTGTFGGSSCCASYWALRIRSSLLQPLSQREYHCPGASHARYESAGVVTALGSGVNDLKVGDRVALEVGLPCL
jgi:hypothetical protein